MCKNASDVLVAKEPVKKLEEDASVVQEDAPVVQEAVSPTLDAVQEVSEDDSTVEASSGEDTDIHPSFDDSIYEDMITLHPIPGQDITFQVSRVGRTKYITITSPEPATTTMSEFCDFVAKMESSEPVAVPEEKASTMPCTLAVIALAVATGLAITFMN